MPAPRTNNHEPRRVYFSRSEALQYLDCTKHWLKVWTDSLGFKHGQKGPVKYSVDELNRLAVIRKTNTPAKFDRVSYMKQYMKKYREMGKGRYVKKFAITAQNNLEKGR